MEKIDRPRVFISYAWGTQEYQMKVLAFATALTNDGIEVLLDKWEISAGNDMNNFMEKSVTDPAVTHVLILLDENYANKANKRAGGVGTETQIISQQVYSSVEQTKFIPIVFERNSNGDVCKPAYLQSRYHFDLSQESNYDTEYKKLVKTLFGVEIYQKPEVGIRPSWVDEKITVSPRVLSAYDSLKENKPDSVRQEQIISYLGEIENSIVAYADTTYSGRLQIDQYIDAYAANREIRKKFLLLITKSVYCPNRAEALGDFFESAHNRLDNINSSGQELSNIFIHELFIYTIAGLIKRKNYTDAGYLLGRTYFPASPSFNQSLGTSYYLFYSGSSHTNLDQAVKKRDDKNYYSGTAQYWISTLDVDYCTKEDFTAADAICYNYSIYGNGYLDHWAWFPVTYVYANEYDNFFTRLAKQLSSKEKLTKILPLFNYDTIEDFIAKCTDVEKAMSQGQFQRYRYNSAFVSAPLLSGAIKSSELGTLR